MTKSSSPWSIKGVSAEARNAAKEGARISRQPLGRWLSQVIEKTSNAEAEVHHAPVPTAAVDSTSYAPHAAPAASAVTWQEAIERLEARIGENEARASSTAQVQNETLERIADRIDSIETYVLRHPRRSYLARLLRR